MNRQSFLQGLAPWKSLNSRCWGAAAMLLATASLLVPAAGYAQTPPPEPSDTSTIGQTVTNPVTGMTTTVSGLITDPAGTPTAGDTAFVQTADGYAFLVKGAGDLFYNNGTPPLAFLIVGPGASPNTVEVDPFPVGGDTADFATRLLETERQALFNPEGTPGVITPPIVYSGRSIGVGGVYTGDGGNNGSPGIIVTPPSAGEDGDPGPPVTINNGINVNTAENHGILAGSVGGEGGRGGDAIFTFWEGRDGGDGGMGGTVEVANGRRIQVATSRDDRHGIFAFSRSGEAGDGGSGFIAPGGGTGGKSADGGSVTVENGGNVITSGEGAFGIYGLSVGDTGGGGGDQWGIVGESGSAGFGGDGGRVEITNRSSGSIFTSGQFAHGILAQSIGGSGGAAGEANNLLVSLLGRRDNGGDGGEVVVTNDGQITTTGEFARGMFAQSIGGGGGTQGNSFGGVAVVAAIGGAGRDGGGNAGRVEAENSATGRIVTTGRGSDGIFVQSIGGSGGAGANTGGLFAIGGDGTAAGNGNEVDVENLGRIETSGVGARGIVAQSIGGGGGDGGRANGAVAVGGRGGGGGDGALVEVTHGGTIITGGDDAIGIVAQSIGGGGGNGGAAGSVSAFAGVAIGGSGDTGGDGGNVDITLQGTSADEASVIRTEGDRATGVLAQSVGGGGGNGGGAVQVSLGLFGAASFAVGGSAADGGDGGVVTLSRGTGDVSVIETIGNDSTGIMLQSVGGGGGNGGYAVGVAGSVGIFGSVSLSAAVGGSGGDGGAGGTVRAGTFDANGNLTEAGFGGSILTGGERSVGLLAQSVGGGGGNGGLAVSAAAAGSDGLGVAVAVGVGGSGGDGGAGGSVSVGFEGNVTTEQDFSSGMLVQSVGGGGGNGGGSITGSLAVGGVGAGSVSVGLGGRAGEGNSGGEVRLATREGTVTTSGEGSNGITVQSVGGGGGNGGYAIAVGVAGAGTGAGAVNVGLGGSGGRGASGGEVNADLESDVDTSGDSSTGILVQSVGGGGGNGGFSVSAGIAAGGTGAGTVGVGLGGSGGSGASGGEVNASSAGTITTRGDNSSGFVVQSVGGGGGNGGFNVTGALAGGGTGSGAVSVGLGGTGGTGATGGEVTASSSGDVRTEGDRSTGILAQSVGGGGGNGGFNVSVALSGAGTGSGAVGVGLGGSGAAGGDASTVNLTVDNNVTTLGDDSTAVVAQSVGGGGGNGGFNVSVSGSGAGTGSAAVGVGLGGSGAAGSDGDFVRSIVNGDLLTMGRNSSGLVVQSIGGGGGNGGFNVSAALSFAGTGSGTVGVGIGGAGGGGGDGGNVESSHTGNVMTLGENAAGVIAQSLGGGGGNGGFNVTGTINGDGSGGAAVSVGIGGSGAGGGDAGTVDNTVTGTVVTAGDFADGVVAQSLGGGGGNGGFNVSGAIGISGGSTGAFAVGIGGSGGGGGDSAAVSNTISGDVTTSGGDAFGVVTQSIGGGGGNGGFNISGSVAVGNSGSGNVGVGIGGSGGAGGNAGNATTTLTGNVVTVGDRSGAVLTQALGGGGGNGALNVTAGLTATSSVGGNLGVGIGGFGGGGGDAGTASVDIVGNVGTTGSDSGGLLVQSIGGGGGNGGLNVTGGLTASGSSAATVGVGIGGFGQGGGSGGAVNGTLTGDIMTVGDDSYGALLQSLGGGGGNGGLNVTAGATISNSGSGTIALGLGGLGGGAGDSAEVTAVITGDVRTEGSDAFGVMAQSLGGGGGNGGINVSGAVNLTPQTSGAAALGVGGFGGGGGDSGDVELTRTGTTRTTGAGADGVIAQSIGGGGGNGGINVSGAIAGSSSGTAVSAALGVGGFGGSGGDAGSVTATVTGDVIATGFESETTETVDGLERRIISGGSNGIVAQSVGGSGGNGGLNVSSGIGLSPGGSSGTGNSLTLGIGGFGGGAGNAGMVDLDVAADNVVAVGDTRSAVLAQSVGGGGGNGALNVSAGIVTDVGVTVGIGGSGGGGGTAADVMADVVVGQVSARGEAARGVVAQSIGGGGGNGGINISGGIQANRDADLPSVVFGMGGSGGSGNSSGSVNLTQTGNVFVEGVNSIGVLAQSLAGGGGNGALNVSGSLAAGEGFAGVVGVGGSGGLGADAGNVILASDGTIDVSGIALAELDEAGEDFTRFGDRTNGILAQSIGGGGGNGGANISGVATRGSPIAVNVGGSGGGGGDAGAVDVTRGATTAALLRTRGDQANGLTAQSVGGGGGNAGMNLQFALSGVATDDEPVSAMITIGGAGGDPGHGAATTVDHTGDIVTDGRQSVGILAQSIGGGGGNANINVAGGFNKKSTAFNLAVGGAPGEGGDGGEVSVTHSGDIATVGDDSIAIFAQSVGGGGGNAAMNMATSLGSSNALNIAIGRVGGDGGIGGNVSVNSDGVLMTAGDRAVGVLAQSVGNAGGKSGATSVGFSSSSGEGESARATGVNVAVGLEGGSGGRAGDVDVVTAGTVVTEGDEAHGLHAQSVGGGGGIGGAATNIVFRETTSVRVGVGGAGGDGGIAGEVAVENDALIATDGDKAHGIYAQSIGGGGGTGGYAGQLAIQAGGASGNGNNSVGVSVGGSGGTGAAGDAVTVTNRGVIVTSGDESTGISAQSIGGGGGDGGIVANGTLAGNGRNNAMTVGIGGAGGSGGISADVSVTNEGVIMTTGREATGIRAQSIAGGGGNAGLVVNLDISRESGSRASRTATMNIGGEGGDGAVAGDVTVVNRTAADGSGGMIATEGDDAYGILAQSIGGGGGNGSSIISGRFARDNNTSGRNATLMSLNVGGFGGNGGVAGNVTVDNEALIDTIGENAHGVFAQSIGGGGGNGGIVLVVNKVFGSAKKASGSRTRGSDRMLSVGGVGGNGGDAGSVTVNNSGQIVTRGENAHGVFAQSIGGGGGNTGWTHGGNSNKRLAGEVKKLVGALGGEGGLGGEVTVNHSGDISVFGDGAQAIKADSINGGGGTMTSKFETIAGILGTDVPELPDLGDILPFEEIPVLELRIGGEEQADTNAGNVTINNTGTFGVFGDNGAGNGSMAIGGGGGTATVDVNLGLVEPADGEVVAIDVDVELGGLDGQNNAGGDLDSRHDGDILSMGRNSHGVALQSIGGGGGRANYTFSGDGSLLGDLAYRLGGTNGSNEVGGAVDHRQDGNVVTEGDFSHGVLVSSVGGGGGSLALTFDFDEAAPAGDDASAPRAMAAHLGATDIALGSNGGSALNGGDVALNHNGGIATTGSLASGLILQSVGSGGGEVRVSGSDNLTVTLGGNGGASGDGGDIDLFVRDSVVTAGDRAHGVVLQSIGGGGGAVFTDLAPASVSFSADNSGDGGAISAVFLRDIVAQGDESYGIIAQSLGGGGGFVDGVFAGTAGGSGTGDAIDLEIAGDVFATGSGSSALLAQSLGTGGGDIRISLSADRMLVGGTGGTAITLGGGAENTVINRGTIMTVDGIDGVAVLAGTGNDTVLNEGRLIGGVDLGGGSNALDNAVDALFETGADVNLGGPGSTLTSAGTIAPGGSNRALETAINGGFVQTESGVLETELDFATDTLDSLLATGDVATDGDVVLSLLNKQVIRPGEFVKTLFGSETAYVDNGVNFVTSPSVVVSYDLLESDNALDLAYAVDFAATGLGDNRANTGDYINRVQLAGSTEALADTIIRLVDIGDLDEYRDVLTQLSPEIYAEQQVQTLAAAQSFLRSVRDRCTIGDAYSVTSEDDECLWVRYAVHDMDRDAETGRPGITGDGRRYAFGWQYRQPGGNLYGVGFALDDTDFSGFDERWATQGRSWQLSAMSEFAMRDDQAFILQLALGQTRYETQRAVAVTESYLAEADSDVVYLSGLVGFLDRWEAGRFRFEHGVDIGFAQLRTSSLSEVGALEQSLIVDKRSDNYFWVTPSIEASTGSTLDNGVAWEVFGRAGLQYYINSSDTASVGALSGGPIGTPGMTTVADLDSSHSIFSLGIRASSGNMRFSLSYEGDDSSGRRIDGINGRWVFSF